VRPALGILQRLMLRGDFDQDGYLVSHPGSPVWTLLHVRGPLDADLLAEAVALVTGEADALRLRLRRTPDGPMMEWAPEATPIALRLLRVPALLSDGRLTAEAAEPLIPVLLGRPDNLRNEPLARCALVSASDREHLLALSVDHLAADGWSMGLILRRLTRSYQALLQGNRPAAARRAAGPRFADHVSALPTLAEQDTALAEWSSLLTGHPLPGPVFRPPGGTAKDPAACQLDASAEFTIAGGALADLAATADRLSVSRPQALGAVTCALATMWSDGPQPVFHVRHGRHRRADIGVVGPLLEMCLGLPPAGDLPVAEWLAAYLAANPVRPLHGRSLWETNQFGPRYVGFTLVPPARSLELAPGTTATPMGGEQLAPLWPDSTGPTKSFAAVWIYYYLDDRASLRLFVKHDSQVLPDPAVIVDGLRTVLAAAAAPDSVPMSRLAAG
jgi:hypothetical protein